MAGRRKTAQGLARRARIVLEASGGLQNIEIAARLDTDANTVSKWRRRFAERRCEGLYDEPRFGRPRTIGDDDIGRTIQGTLEETSPGATHWSLRSMARATGYAPSTIHRIARATMRISMANLVYNFQRCASAASAWRFHERAHHVPTEGSKSGGFWHDLASGLTGAGREKAPEN